MITSGLLNRYSSAKDNINESLSLKMCYLEVFSSEHLNFLVLFIIPKILSSFLVLFVIIL